MPTYTTSTVMSTVPLELTFTCAHCGTIVSMKKYIRLDGQIAVNGYGANIEQSSGSLAQMQMMSSAGDTVRRTAEQLGCRTPGRRGKGLSRTALRFEVLLRQANGYG